MYNTYVHTVGTYVCAHVVHTEYTVRSIKSLHQDTTTYNMYILWVRTYVHMYVCSTHCEYTVRSIELLHQDTTITCTYAATHIHLGL